MSNILKGKNALVTGASDGLGRHIALQLAKKGCNLFLTGRNEQSLQKVKNQIKEAKVEYETADLTNVEEIKTLCENIRGRMGNIDVLVNCAGVFPVNSFENSSLLEYDECFDLNVKAPFLLTKAFIPSMIDNQWGRVINIASSSAYNGSKDTSIYCASKHALLGLTRSLSKEYNSRNIRFFCVSPGSIKTQMGKKVEQLGQIYDTFIDPQDIAKYICFSISYNGNMISDEIRLNRVVVQ
tara:strand:+ start:12888 stop:13604 length:717 start_codon:yes stop_codon:yes gene_type:complete